jgi:hypothetical protein
MATPYKCFAWAQYIYVTPLAFGLELANRWSHHVPLFSLFDWASSNIPPEGDPRKFFALQTGEKFLSYTMTGNLLLGQKHMLSALPFELVQASGQQPHHCVPLLSPLKVNLCIWLSVAHFLDSSSVLFPC